MDAISGPNSTVNEIFFTYYFYNTVHCTCTSVFKINQ